jgi:hypothetical protein
VPVVAGESTTGVEVAGESTGGVTVDGAGVDTAGESAFAESPEPEALPLLSQATNVPAMAKTAKNFFMCCLIFRLFKE